MTNFSFTKIDVPAAAGTYQYISVDGDDAAGEAVGNYGSVDGDGDGTFHGLTATGSNGITSDPPGSSNTDIVGITSSGEIFGDYVDWENRQHGFVETNGVVTPVDIFLANSTVVDGVTNAGVIYGTFADGANGVHGFIDNNGNFTGVDVAGAFSTSVAGINAAGTIVGEYSDAQFVGHGFVETNGAFTTIDPAGSIYTSMVGISDSGEIAGNYQDSSNYYFGFVDNDGMISKINIPGAISSGVSAINAAGEIVGYYIDSGNNVHGFVDNGGVITTVDGPGATQTDILGISATGVISGYYNDASGQHGFVGTLPTSTIESFGTTNLVEVGNNYFLEGTAGAPSAELKYDGTAFTAGEWGAWSPIGVEATATGYEVAFKVAGGNTYTVWDTDQNGNIITDPIGTVSGTSTALEALEPSFHQDLNGDGVIGIPGATVIEQFGATSLDQIGNGFFMYANGTATGPELKYDGTPWVSGEWGAWAPIAAEATATGYEVAFKVVGSNTYTVWDTDSGGSITVDPIGTVSGNSTALEMLEPSFHQDLNGDGVFGLPPIERAGSTSLVAIGNDYFLNGDNGTVGPELKYGGTPFTANEWGGWMPIGAEAIATGYEVAWKYTGADLYTVWDTDSNGNITSDPIGTVSGSSAALQALEPGFYQDLNGDGLIDLSTTVIEAKGDILLTQNPLAQPSEIDAGATLELTGADSLYVEFLGPTGTLMLDHSTEFNGQVLNLAGNGNLPSSDQLDLRDIGFGPGTTVGYAGTSVGGILTVSDAQNHTAHITLAGDYTSSTFSLSSDGSGGTIVIDPVDNQPAAGGSLSFSDPDPTDTPAVSVTPQNGGAFYLGSFVANAPTAANGQITVGWHFNFNASPVAETVTQSYAVTVADHHADGTTSAATQTVSITIAGPGNDAFVFHPGTGSDTIVNAASSDTIEPDGFSGVTSGNQLATLLNEAQTGQMQSLFRAVNGGHDTLINLGNHDSIMLTGVQIADLHASDFLIH